MTPPHKNGSAHTSIREDIEARPSYTLSERTGGMNVYAEVFVATVKVITTPRTNRFGQDLLR